MSKVTVGSDVKVSWVSNDGDIEIRDAVINLLKEKYGNDVVQGEPLTEGQMPKVFNYAKPKQENKWRGGSRGKGGKTKWPRR